MIKATFASFQEAYLKIPFLKDAASIGGHAGHPYKLVLDVSGENETEMDCLAAIFAGEYNSDFVVNNGFEREYPGHRITVIINTITLG